ncbi:hypothetical protein AB0C27_53775 [Nonomuraea sp. NPDC048882]|uniref:hypothetical protein n=1 Tax=Nonomuraea sp. NPDC048882 TaxID=3154347 RepID=UPI0033FC7A7B
MGDTPAIAFGLFSLALGILLYRKRMKLIRSGSGAALAVAGAKPTGGKLGGGSGSKDRWYKIPAAVLYRIISGLMFLGGVGLASTFIGDWLRSWDFSIGPLGSTACATILALLLGVAVLIDVFDGNGLKPLTYAMIVSFPLLWATAGGSLAWPRALSAQAWLWMTGAV